MLFLTHLCAISMSPVLARFTSAILYSVLYLAHTSFAIFTMLFIPITPIKVLSIH